LEPRPFLVLVNMPTGRCAGGRCLVRYRVALSYAALGSARYFWCGVVGSSPAVRPNTGAQEGLRVSARVDESREMATWQIRSACPRDYRPHRATFKLWPVPNVRRRSRLEVPRNLSVRGFSFFLVLLSIFEDLIRQVELTIDVAVETGHEAQAVTARSNSFAPSATDTVCSSPVFISRTVQMERFISSSPRMAA
jgi:hypothetical protein